VVIVTAGTGPGAGGGRFRSRGGGSRSTRVGLCRPVALIDKGSACDRSRPTWLSAVTGHAADPQASEAALGAVPAAVSALPGHAATLGACAGTARAGPARSGPAAAGPVPAMAEVPGRSCPGGPTPPRCWAQHWPPRPPRRGTADQPLTQTGHLTKPPVWSTRSTRTSSPETGPQAGRPAQPLTTPARGESPPPVPGPRTRSRHQTPAGGQLLPPSRQPDPRAPSQHRPRPN
jgi:hypothetical protein